MQRAICGFRQDEQGDWVARLECGHGQHLRHRPPFVERPWVTTPAGRAAHLGKYLECLRCERLELPDGHRPYRRTPVFDAASVPAALRARHSTKAGVWGVIHVLEGRLRYCLEAPRARELILDAATPGHIPPQVEHAVEPLGPARFYVEFHRAGQ